MSDRTLAKHETLIELGIVERAVVQGDLSKLSSQERTNYYSEVCKSLGLNPLTKPFDYIVLNGKMRLYALKDCTEQLRAIHGVSLRITGRESIDGVFVVTAQAETKVGKFDESIGAVPIDNLKGEAKANAMMKAETKAKRRVTLSVCGLGMLDESEVGSIPATAKDAEITAREEEREQQSRNNHRQEQPRQLPPPQEAEVVCESIDWREFRVHFGKNRGLLLEELSPQQTRWYWEDWMPKKEAGNTTMSIEDIKLIDALKAWRQERDNAKPQAKTVPRPVQPQPEDESQEPVAPFETLKAKAGADNITPDELADYLRAQKNGQGSPLLGEDEAVINLSDERILALLTKWDKHRTSIHAARKKRLADELSATAPLNI